MPIEDIANSQQRWNLWGEAFLRILLLLKPLSAPAAKQGRVRVCFSVGLFSPEGLKKTLLSQNELVFNEKTKQRNKNTFVINAVKSPERLNLFRMWFVLCGVSCSIVFSSTQQVKDVILVPSASTCPSECVIASSWCLKASH